MRDVPTGLAWLALATVLLAVPAGSHAASDRALQRPMWKLAYEHYDSRIGEGGAGIDVITSGHQRPLALALRPRGSTDHYSQPAFSPQGTHVAYIRSASDRDELYVVQTNGTDRQRLASGRILDYVWSDDGEWVAFAADCASGFAGGCRSGRIEVVARDSTRNRVLVTPTGLSRAAEIDLQGWSRRGELLYIIRDQGHETLFLVSGSGRPRALADSRTGGELGGASWSSQGNLIAYMRRCGERIDVHCDLAVMERGGRSKRLLRRWGPGATGPSFDAPTWIPGSSRLLLTVWGFGAHTLLLDARTGQSQTIAKSPWSDVTVKRVGRTIARLERALGGPVFVVVARIDGSVLERGKLPRAVPLFGGDFDHDLWVG